MHTIRIKQIDGSLNNNAYSTVSKRVIDSSHSKGELESTGSRRAYATFYGLNPDEVSKTVYARCKQAIEQPTSFPKQVKSTAFNYGQNRSKTLGSRDNGLRNKNLANAGNLVVNPESQDFKRAQRIFHMLPSQSTAQAQRPTSHQTTSDQSEQIKEILGESKPFNEQLQSFYSGYTPQTKPIAPKSFANYKDRDEDEIQPRKIDSSSRSFASAQRRFWGIESRVTFLYFNPIFRTL